MVSLTINASFFAHSHTSNFRGGCESANRRGSSLSLDLHNLLSGERTPLHYSGTQGPRGPCPLKVPCWAAGVRHIRNLVLETQCLVWHHREACFPVHIEATLRTATLDCLSLDDNVVLGLQYRQQAVSRYCNFH